MHQRGYVPGGAGNVSVRLDDDTLLITPSGVNKGFLRPEDLVLTDLDGRVLAGDRPPSSEIFMHLKAYERRADVRAVVHAHPPYAVALTLAGIDLDDPVLPEVVLLLGRIPTARYATPSTPEGAEVVQDLVTGHNALLLDRHGSLTMGTTLDQAFDYLEILEHAARIIIAARQLGPVSPLPEAKSAKLLRLGREKGFLPK